MTTRSQLAALRTLADEFDRRALPALREIARLRSEHDGWPVRGDGAGRSSGPSIVVPDEAGNPDRIPLTSVEAAVLSGGARSALALARDAERIVSAVRDAAAAFHAALNVCDRYAAKVDASALRCTGGAGLVGAIEWGRPDCTNVQAEGRRDGLCDACRMRRSRWQRRAEVA